MGTATDVLTATTTARGPLRPLPRLRPPLLPIPTTDTDTVSATATPDTDTATAMGTATTVKCPSLPAVISTANLGTPLLFKNQVKNGLLQFGFRPPPVPPFQCYQPSLTSNGQQEAPENQNVTIR